MKKYIFTIILSAYLLGSADQWPRQYKGTVYGGFEDLLRLATDIAGALGTRNSGQLHRRDNCYSNWSYQGQVKGIQWKYLGTCIDNCTHLVETVFTKSRAGAVEHCIQNLLHKINRRGEL